MALRLNHDDIREEYDRGDPAYSYYTSMKKKYKYEWMSCPFLFRGWLNMERLYFDSMGGLVCSLTGKPELWAPGENPSNSDKPRWRDFHVDHDPKLDPKVYGLFSIRGWVSQDENECLKHIDKRPELWVGRYGKYIKNPPFQIFIKKIVGPKKYRELLEEIRNGL